MRRCQSRSRNRATGASTRRSGWRIDKEKQSHKIDVEVALYFRPFRRRIENDTIVPMTLGKRLYGLIQAPKRFVRIAGAGHNDLGADAVAAAKRSIVEQ